MSLGERGHLEPMHGVMPGRSMKTNDRLVDVPGSSTAPGFVIAILSFSLAGAQAASVSNAAEPNDPKATEQWEPVPKLVTPGDIAGSPPSDAIVLFDGRDLDQWESCKDGSPARWKVHDGVMTVDKSAGNIQTKQLFRNYQLHLEWRVPEGITGEGQARGNSGLFLASTGRANEGYEIQILDSWKNKTYVNGQAASVYKQAPPLVNAMRAPGRWQTYDVVWTAPVFAPDGRLESSAYVTLFHNGVLVQNHREFSGETTYIGKPRYKPFAAAAIKLQAHDDPSPPISFRNIWVRRLD